jgi:DNA-binding LytR/AlgR family response regulator
MSENTTTQPATYTQRKKSRFIVFYKESILSIKTVDVSYFTLEKGSVQLFTLNGKGYHLKKSLSEIAELLDPQLFFQVSRSAIVSFDGIDRVEAYFGQRAMIFMKSSGKILVTKSRLPAFLEWLDQ